MRLPRQVSDTEDKIFFRKVNVERLEMIVAFSRLLKKT